MSIESVRTSARRKCGIAHYALLFGDSDESVNPSSHHFRSNISSQISLVAYIDFLRFKSMSRYPGIFVDEQI